MLISLRFLASINFHYKAFNSKLCLVKLTNYWIITVSEENWQVVKANYTYGAPDTSISKSAHNLIKPGDIIIFYVRKRTLRILG